MSDFSFKLPDLGEGIVESEIVEWHITVGDTVEEDQHIADVMTDKAVVEVTAPVSGLVIRLACAAGEVLAVGAELILFKRSGESNAAATKGECTVIPSALETPSAAVSATDTAAAATATATATAPSPITAAPAVVGTAKHRQILTSPSVRMQARNNHIDLALVAGTGPAGRISNSDLANFIAAGGIQASLPSSPVSSFNDTTTTVKIKGLRRIIGQKMLAASQNIPHYSYVEEIDLTALEELRQHLNNHRQAEQAKLTLLPFIMQALIKAVADFPQCNAHYDDKAQTLMQHQAVHIGIATMTEKGLLVPVIKDAQSLDIWQSAAELTRITQVSRAGTAKQAELVGSTITITSLGVIGGIVTTPIINAPETTIIGVNKLQERPVVRNGAIVIRKMMNLSSSFDHRIVDGYEGAQLIQTLKRLLENPGAIFV